MTYKINAAGLQCPEPVILAKKGIESHGDIEITVDNDTAVENIGRLGTKLGCKMNIVKGEKGLYHINIKNCTEAASIISTPEGCRETGSENTGGPVVVISGDTMGKGNDELGRILMKAFIHTILEADTKPGSIIFYNSGVKLAAAGSDVAGDLVELEKTGVEILICGTCAAFFGMKDNIAAGHISNMYDIVNYLTAAARIIQP